MDYSGPECSDLNDVQSINLAFLTFLGRADGERLRSLLPPALQPALTALSTPQLERLAAVPFLLLSLNEANDEFWRSAPRGKPIRDLFTPAQDVANPLCRIATAAVGFLWQLARRNPYAARITCGASLGWCEQLAAQTLMQVLEVAADDCHMLMPRCADDNIFWHRLLGAGVSSEASIRRAAHMSALQTVLLPVTAGPARRFRSAACYSSVPSVQRNSKPKPGEEPQ